MFIECEDADPAGHGDGGTDHGRSLKDPPTLLRVSRGAFICNFQPNSIRGSIARRRVT